MVALGDSITDGHGSTVNGNDRWPDVLAQKLASRNIGVLNEGIGGNHLLTDGLGPNALARFDRDVTSHPNAHRLIVLEGINDIGGLAREAPMPAAAHMALVRRIIAAFKQIALRAHAHGMIVAGATILPFAESDYYHPDAATEADRQTVNAWIRAAGIFDSVIDLDALTRDPARPDHLLAAYDSGDHLHPGPQGYRAMGGAVAAAARAEPTAGAAAQRQTACRKTCEEGSREEGDKKMKRKALLLAGLFAFFAARASAQDAPQLAFTFDDLPAHSTLPPGVTRVQVAHDVIAALKAAKLPPVYGFVNGIQIDNEPASAPVLRMWREAGFPLGNHTFSHMNLNQHSAEDWEADTLRNEPLLIDIMHGDDWRWLRYPFLSEGETPQKRQQIREFLAKNNWRYRVASVTMSFADYAFNEPYARCMAKGDTAAVAQMEKDYLDAAEENVGFYRAMAHTLYGRDIPYVLLMHIGAFDARMLPRLLALYKKDGFVFVTLQQAESDPYYLPFTDLTQPQGPPSLEAAMAEKHLPLPPRTDYPAKLETVCR